MTHRPRHLISRRRALTGGIAFTAVVLLVAGCAADSDGYADLERERTSADHVPREIIDAFSEGFEADYESARFVGEDDGASLWLMPGDQANRVCLLSWQGPEDGVIGCGQKGVEFTSGNGSRTYQVVPNGWVTNSEHVTQISSNVYAKTGPTL